MQKRRKIYLICCLLASMFEIRVKLWLSKSIWNQAGPYGVQFTSYRLQKILGSGSGAKKVHVTENLSISNFDFLILDHFAKMKRNSRDKGWHTFYSFAPWISLSLEVPFFFFHKPWPTISPRIDFLLEQKRVCKITY